MVTSLPEIMVHTRGSSGKEEVLLLACDGVWDVFNDQDAGEFLLSTLDVPLGDVSARITPRDMKKARYNKNTAV